MHLYNRLIKHFEASCEELHKIGHAFTAVILEAGQCLPLENHIRPIVFVGSGIIAEFTISTSEELEVPQLFYSDNDWVCFRNSKNIFRAIVNAVLYIVGEPDLDALLVKIPRAKELKTMGLKSQLDKLDKYYEISRLGFAHLQYALWTKQNPHLANRIPLKFVAQMLHISPQQLSRIRRKYTYM